MAEPLIAELTIEVRAEASTLPDIAYQLSVIDRTWVVAAAFASHREGLTAWTEGKFDRGYTPRPYDVRLTKQSPMVIDIAVNDVLPWGLTSGTVVMFLYFLRNPGKLGSFWHDITAAHHNSIANSEEAKRAAWLQRQINKELMTALPRDPDLSEGERTSRVLNWLADDIASLNAQVMDSNDSD